MTGLPQSTGGRVGGVNVGTTMVGSVGALVGPRCTLGGRGVAGGTAVLGAATYTRLFGLGSGVAFMRLGRLTETANAITAPCSNTLNAAPRALRVRTAPDSTRVVNIVSSA